MSAFVVVVLLASACSGQGSVSEEPPRLPELNWTPRSDWMSVRAAGAKGDGIADDTSCIQQVLDRLSNKRPKGEPRQHVAYFPPGRYRITRTLTVTESTGAWLVGHGQSTVLVWDGEQGGRMYWSNGCNYVCYEGLTWDGRDSAAILVEHQSHSYYETWIRYLHCAFINARDHGLVVGHGGATVESAELWFRNCLFADCGEGGVLPVFQRLRQHLRRQHLRRLRVRSLRDRRSRRPGELADPRVPIPGEPGVGRETGRHLPWLLAAVLCFCRIEAFPGDLPQQCADAHANRGLPRRGMDGDGRGDHAGPCQSPQLLFDMHCWPL